jgi:hypothetical protein
MLFVFSLVTSSVTGSLLKGCHRFKATPRGRPGIQIYIRSVVDNLISLTRCPTRESLVVSSEGSWVIYLSPTIPSTPLFVYCLDETPTPASCASIPGFLVFPEETRSGSGGAS